MYQGIRTNATLSITCKAKVIEIVRISNIISIHYMHRVMKKIIKDNKDSYLNIKITCNCKVFVFVEV